MGWGFLGVIFSTTPPLPPLNRLWNPIWKENPSMCPSAKCWIFVSLIVHYLESVSVCVSVCLSVCPSVRLSVCVSARPSVCLSVCPSVCLCVRPSVCVSVRLSVCPSVCPCVPPSVRVSVCLSVCPSVCLSVCHTAAATTKTATTTLTWAPFPVVSCFGGTPTDANARPGTVIVSV